jgi:hypothetical protein
MCVWEEPGELTGIKRVTSAPVLQATWQSSTGKLRQQYVYSLTGHGCISKQLRSATNTVCQPRIVNAPYNLATAKFHPSTVYVIFIRLVSVHEMSSKTAKITISFVMFVRTRRPHETARLPRKIFS